MVLKPEPIFEAVEATEQKHGPFHKILLCPRGTPYTQRKARELAQKDQLLFLCGRYEGFDERIRESHVWDEISIGDYVISSGEISTLVMVDAIYRLLDGVINRESLEEESFTQPLLEYPHYTRPEEFRGLRVPEILLGGHHANIEAWRLRKRVEKTLANRPDLLDGDGIDKEIRRVRDELRWTSEG